MVETAVPKGTISARVAFDIAPVNDPNYLRSMLLTDPAYSAYASAHLEPRLFARCRWWLASSGGAQGLVLHTHGGLGPALVTFGDSPAVDAILHIHPGPRLSFATFKTEHLSVIERHFMVSRKRVMQRMAVSEAGFRPAEKPAGDGVTIQLLRGTDISQINRLYGTEGGPASYSHHNIEEGVYYGVGVEGRLVSIAGTHVVSPVEKVAVIGNVFTHPRHRGLGWATLATSAVTEHLLKECNSVLLTVETTNIPAVRVYEKLGYREECRLYETTVLRRQMLGALALFRRFLAGRRGAKRRSEVVIR